MKAGGYVALYRSVFDNKKLDDVASRREAWIWLFTHAAWKPTLQRAGRSMVNVHRGQLAITTRALAAKWGWALGRTKRFIGFLKREHMITVQLAGPTPDSTCPQMRLGCMVISICNYATFQTEAKPRIIKPIQQPDRKKQQTLPFVYVLALEEPNNRLDSSLVESRKAKIGRKRVLKVGTRSKHGTIFIPFDHPQYPDFAIDFREATGQAPVPVDGGNWFWPSGEASRPANLLHLRPKRPA